MGRSGTVVAESSSELSFLHRMPSASCRYVGYVTGTRSREFERFDGGVGSVPNVNRWCGTGNAEGADSDAGRKHADADTHRTDGRLEPEP